MGQSPAAAELWTVGTVRPQNVDVVFRFVKEETPLLLSVDPLSRFMYLCVHKLVEDLSPVGPRGPLGTRAPQATHGKKTRYATIPAIRCRNQEWLETKIGINLVGGIMPVAKKAPAKKKAAPAKAAALKAVGPVEAEAPEVAPPQGPPQSSVVGLTKQVARVKVVAGAAVTWLVAISTAVTIASDEIVKVLPDSSQSVGAVSLKVVAWLGAAVAIIRRVTPVIPEDRGILPQNP